MLYRLVYHYSYFLMLKTSSDSYLVKFCFRGLKRGMLMFITSFLGEMDSNMSCLNKKLIPF